MKFLIVEPIEDKSLVQKNEGWILSEKIETGKGLYAAGIVLGIILAGIFSFIIKTTTLCKTLDFYVYKKIILFLLVIPLHEISHIIFFPSLNNTVIGFSWKKGVFYVSSSEIFSKKRLLITIILPFLLLTIIPYFFLYFINSETIAYISLYNLIGSGIDLITFFKILSITEGNQFRYNGTNLYFRKVSKE
ncbi:MAG: DUF3267 domain-containing protein [Tenuifilum sp.]|uniref:DUF3267 domain-containing protein n=1 Tax=Tenuifilum sp. TaxID=2760880 RepID=UPI0030ABA757